MCQVCWDGVFNPEGQAPKGDFRFHNSLAEPDVAENTPGLGHQNLCLSGLGMQLQCRIGQLQWQKAVNDLVVLGRGQDLVQSYD